MQRSFKFNFGKTEVYPFFSLFERYLRKKPLCQVNPQFDSIILEDIYYILT